MAVRGGLRRPVAVWGHLAPREPSGPLSGVLWPSGAVSGVLWPFGGIWPPESRLGRSPASCGRQGRSPASCGRLGASGPQRAVWAALRRPVAVRGGLRAQEALRKTRKCLLIQTSFVWVVRQHTLVATTRLRLALTTRAGEGATRPLQSPESRQGGCKTFLPLPWEGDVSQVLPPSISVRSGPAASLAALRASGPAMCVATLGFIA